MILVGITGILGSGKTTLSTMLSKEGYDVIDVDKLGKQVTETEEVVNEIRRRLGEDFVVGNRASTERLRDTVFGSPEKLRKLESIIHPRARAELMRRVEELRKRRKKVVIIDAPLLFETDLHGEVDRSVVVSADTDTIRQRLRKRGMTEEDVSRRLRQQIPLPRKEGMADHVVYNSGSKKDLRAQMVILMRRIDEWEGQKRCT
jgi:dephospho-CoA kinase